MQAYCRSFHPNLRYDLFIPLVVVQHEGLHTCCCTAEVVLAQRAPRRRSRCMYTSTRRQLLLLRHLLRLQSIQAMAHDPLIVQLLEQGVDVEVGAVRLSDWAQWRLLDH